LNAAVLSAASERSSFPPYASIGRIFLIGKRAL
jgi:hypothetical protein